MKEAAILPSEEYYHLCAVSIFFTHLSQQSEYLPYLWIHGLPERGKSRLLKAMAPLVWRGFYTETLNQATMFRFAENFRGTLIIDVYELVKTATKMGSYDMLLLRFEQGSKVARVLNIDGGPFKDTRYFHCSGPTIIATNIAIDERDPLITRCIPIIMPEARGRYPNLHFNELISVRIGLLHFRATYMDKPLPDVDKPADGRLGDLMHPLIAVAKLLPPMATENLLALIETLECDRQLDAQQTLPGRIVKVLFDKKNIVFAGKMSVSKLSELLNKNHFNILQTNPIKVGRELKALGIKRKKSGGYMHIEPEGSRLDQLFKRYGCGSES